MERCIGGTAHAAIEQYPKQLWCVTTGSGKSYSICALVIAYLEDKGDNKVVLVFSTLHLKNVHMKLFKDVYRVYVDRIQYQVLNDVRTLTQLDKGHLAIIDEADKLVFLLGAGTLDEHPLG